MTQIPSNTLLSNVQSFFPEWESLSSDSLSVQRLTGFSNIVYKLTVDSSLKKDPSNVIYREFLNSNSFVSRQQENYIFNYLSDARLGPKNLGTTENYRLEEFIQGDHPNPSYMRSREFKIYMAKALASLHELSVEGIEKTAKMKRDLENEDLITNCNKHLVEVNLTNEEKEKTKEVIKTLKEEASFIKSELPENDSIKFCHNDLCANNIMIRNAPDGIFNSLVLIDFEYSGYNYRAYDIANFFNETTFDYSLNVSPFFIHSPETFPKIQEIEEFAAFYIYFKKMQKLNLDINENIFEKNQDSLLQESQEQGWGDEFEIECKALVKEIKICVLYSLFFWMIWCMVGCKNEKIDFDYIQHAYDRLLMYKTLKMQFFGY